MQLEMVLCLINTPSSHPRHLMSVTTYRWLSALSHSAMRFRPWSLNRWNFQLLTLLFHMRHEVVLTSTYPIRTSSQRPQTFTRPSSWISITWTFFDLQYAISYWWSFVTHPLSLTVFFCIQVYPGHDLDLLASCDVTGQVLFPIGAQL